MNPRLINVCTGFLMLCNQPYIITQAESAITNPKRFDGFGAQFLHIIDSALYADFHSAKFIYTPFSAMEHNYDNDPDFLLKKEVLINFIGNFDLNTDPNTSTPPHALNFFNENVDRCINSEMYKKIKRIFKQNKNIKTYFNPERFNIAVHVRRPNSHDSRLDGADTPDDVYLSIIDKLRIFYKDQKPVFHIYSQGALEMFIRYVADDIVLHINDSVEFTFASMVFADVLVTSRSDLSYVAGMLSDGIVYYTPYSEHVTLPHWRLAKDL